MLTPFVEIQGTLTSDGTLFLDQAPDLPPGRVRVSLRLDPEEPPRGPVGRREGGPLAGAAAGGEEEGVGPDGEGEGADVA